MAFKACDLSMIGFMREIRTELNAATCQRRTDRSQRIPTVDRERPTLIIDEADDLFCRKSDLRAIVNAGWSRGTRIPRLGRWYDPFCPKILGILGKTKLPRTIASRSIILRMWPKKPEEKAEDFAYADDPEFSTIRRKLARWAADKVSIIKELKPPQPPGFNNRLSANWKLPLQIAQHAGGGWPEQARRSAIYLSRTPYEPSIGVQLLAALRAMFTKNRREITSEQVVQELLVDPDSQWHEYRSRGPITKNQVAALLKDFEIRPVVVHPTKRADLSRHGYRAAQFEDALARFLPPEPNIRGRWVIVKTTLYGVVFQKIEWAPAYGSAALRGASSFLRRLSERDSEVVKPQFKDF